MNTELAFLSAPRAQYMAIFCLEVRLEPNFFRKASTATFSQPTFTAWFRKRPANLSAYEDNSLSRSITSGAQRSPHEYARISVLLRSQEGNDWRSKLPPNPDAGRVLAALSAASQRAHATASSTQECCLIHADLSEYNMLWHEGQVYFIDVSQSVEPSHPHALEFLLRDCTNVSSFFSRAGLSDVMTPQCLTE